MRPAARFSPDGGPLSDFLFHYRGRLVRGGPVHRQRPGPHQETVLIRVSPGDGHATIRWTLKRGGVIRELFHYDAARILAGTSFVPKEGEFQILPGRVFVRSWRSSTLAVAISVG